MKRVLIIPIALLFACGGVATPNKTAVKLQQTGTSDVVVTPPFATDIKPDIDTLSDKVVFQDSLFLSNYLSADYITYTACCDRNKIVQYIKTHNIVNAPYRSIKRINEELSDLMEQDELFTGNLDGGLLVERLKFHLSNPLTYKNLIKVDGITNISSSDGRLRFYTLNVGVTIYGPYFHALQYIDSKGQFKMHEGRSPSGDISGDLGGEIVTAVYNFRRNGTTYYVIQSIVYTSPSLPIWLMEVATFQDGEFTYHNELIPEHFRRVDGIAVVSEIEEYDFNSDDLSISYSTTIDDQKVNRTTTLRL